MSEQVVKRYDWRTDVGCMVEEKDGAWVSGEDYDALYAGAEELQQKLAAFEELHGGELGLPSEGWPTYHKRKMETLRDLHLGRIDRLESEVEALRADLRCLVIQLHAMEGRTEHSDECQAELAELTTTPQPATDVRGLAITPAMIEAGANEVVAPIATAGKKAEAVFRAMLAALPAAGSARHEKHCLLLDPEEPEARCTCRIYSQQSAPELVSVPVEFQPDRACEEADGCPTELAVLKRFWREHRAQELSGPIREAIKWADHLLFECGALTHTRAPSVHVYNKTFAAVEIAKALLASHAEGGKV